MPGDWIVAVNGNRVADIGADQATNMVKGKAGTTVDITICRDGQEQVLTLTRRQILTQVVSGYMITDTIGYIKIHNFDDRCSQEAMALFEDLEGQGAKAFIFDVRFNPGGYKHELVTLLDFLLPEGVLFRSEDYRGVTAEDKSKPSCKDYPMAVLVNADSYSAAEFFAAALVEYEYAFTVGQNTTGKGHFQTTIELSDGSAVNLSIGRYFTPKGVSLAEVGGIVVDVPVEIDAETAALLYGEMLPPEDDLQLQTAVTELEKRIEE
jgi:carboxyl-terminal processing protease